MKSSAPQLRLVSDREVVQAFADPRGAAVGIAAPPRPPARRAATGRPWDQVVAWWLPQSPEATALTRAARTRHVPAGIAATVVIERALAIGDLAATGATDAATYLDRRARCERIARPLGGVAAVYLRQLAGAGSPAPRSGPAALPDPSSATGPITIPGRVAARLAGKTDADVANLLAGNAGDLDVALAWERAALAEGRTIAEWAALQILAR